MLYIPFGADRVYNVTFPAYDLYMIYIPWGAAEGNIEHKPGMLTNENMRNKLNS
jgi:hypothetical protein